MKVRFYNFKKRVNSTAQPIGALYTEKDCVLKIPTSEHDPTIEIEGAINPSWNYCYISDWGKYYFIRDAITVAHNITQYVCTEDTLATYKSDITSSSQYVAHSSDSSAYDIYKVDTRVIASAIKTVKSVSQSLSFLSDSGTYILTVMNDTTPAKCQGIGVSYAMDAASLGVLRNALVDPTVMQTISQALGGNALEAIFGCIWVPFAVDTHNLTSPYGTHVTDIKIGQTSFGGLHAIRLDGYVTESEGVALTLTGALRDDFRRAEPYTSGVLYLPGVGCIEVSMSDWITAHQIQIRVIYEIATGNVLYILRDPDGYIIQTASYCMATQCPIGQFNINTQGVVTSMAGMIGAAAAFTAGSIGYGVAMTGILIAGSNGVLNCFKHASSLSGHVGGRVSSTIKEVSLTIFEIQTEDPNAAAYKALKGLPVGKVVNLNSITGFCQCDGGSLEAAASGIELEEINNYLNSGFYIE